MVINGFLVGNKVANRLFLSEYSIVLVEHSGSKIDKILILWANVKKCYQMTSRKLAKKI